MSIRIGAASWTDKPLLDSGRFYPPHVNTPAARLRFYAARFPLVEVDNSYYSIPTAQSSQQWVERTPEGFVINVKAFRLFTGHQTSPAVLPAEIREALPQALKTKSVLYYRELPAELLDELWARFAAVLAPLQAAGRLGLVHFQFPPWLVRNRAGHAHVAHCVERLAGCRLSAEFRNISWLDAAHAHETLAFLRSLGVVHTIVDEPQGFSNSVPAVWETSVEGLALVRMHGRNAMAWNSSTGRSSERFNYDYPAIELESLARRIHKLDRIGMQVHVVLNNNAEEQAQRNGRTLMDLMEALGMDVLLPEESAAQTVAPSASAQSDWLANVAAA